MLKRVLVFILSAVLLPALAGCGEEERPTSVSRVLDNGLTVVASENRAARVVALQAWVTDGALYEEPGEAGEAYLLANSVLVKASDGDVAESLDALGGALSRYSSHDFALFSVIADARHFEEALDLFHEGLVDPVLDDDVLSRAREQLPAGTLLGDGPIDDAYRLATGGILPEHPYGRDPEGTVSTTAGITTEELVERHRRMYVGNGMVVVVVGAVDATRAVSAVEARFGSLDEGAPPEPAAGPPTWPREPVSTVRRSDVGRAFATFAFPGPGVGDPESVAMDVLTGILWRGGTSGLQRLLVDELELTSSVSVGWYTRRQPSPVYIWVELEPGALETAESAILGAVSRLAADGPSPEEVEDIVEAVRASMLFNRETAEGQAHNIGYWTSIGHLGFHEEYMESLDEVSAENIRQLAERHLRARSRSVGAIVPLEGR